MTAGGPRRTVCRDFRPSIGRGLQCAVGLGMPVAMEIPPPVSGWIVLAGALGAAAGVAGGVLVAVVWIVARALRAEMCAAAAAAGLRRDD